MKLFVDNLTHVDFSYIHSTRGLLGESWQAQLILDGTLNDEGMICDFSIVKKTVKQWLDTYVDHTLVVADLDPNVQLEMHGAQIDLNWTYPNGDEFFCRSPKDAITPVDLKEITPEGMAHWCEQQLLKCFPKEVEGLSLVFIPETVNGHSYHYSHGLKKHAGNCQRICHGHRSTIEIYLNGTRSDQWEAEWTKRWTDIYVGTTEDLTRQPDDYHYYQYQASQGEFELKIPANVCYLIGNESTVEHIAEHIALETKKELADDSIEVLVKAFEGIGKGAIASA